MLDKLSVDAEADALDMLLTLRSSLRCAYGDEGDLPEPGNCDDGLVPNAEDGVGAKLSFGERPFPELEPYEGRRSFGRADGASFCGLRCGLRCEPDGISPRDESCGVRVLPLGRLFLMLRGAVLPFDRSADGVGDGVAAVANGLSDGRRGVPVAVGVRCPPLTTASLSVPPGRSVAAFSRKVKSRPISRSCFRFAFWVTRRQSLITPSLVVGA